MFRVLLAGEHTLIHGQLLIRHGILYGTIDVTAATT